MVEVCRTNVEVQERADFLIKQLLMEFPDYKINFDLEDCDNILRVEDCQASINVEAILKFIKGYGYNAEVLSNKPKMYKNSNVPLKCKLKS